MGFEADLEQQLRADLRLPIRLAAIREEAPQDALLERERERSSQFTSEARRQEWLRGRAALKRLLATLGEPLDTTLLPLPGPRFSLTHGGPWAIALGLPPSNEVQGVGIDFEPFRPVKAEALRFFLQDDEQAWLKGAPRGHDEALRLWTVKEALFKADSLNHAMVLRDFVLRDPAATRGEASCLRHDHGGTFRFASVRLPQGIVSVAALSGTRDVTQDQARCRFMKENAR